jgi:hypothetical protein
MATAKLTIQRGKVDLKDVIVSAGVAEAQSDTISVNIDVTSLSKGEAILLLEEVKQKIFASPWPLI